MKKPRAHPPMNPGMGPHAAGLDDDGYRKVADVHADLGVKLRRCRVCSKHYESSWAKKTICPTCDIAAGAVKINASQARQMGELAGAGAFSRERSHFGSNTSPGTVGSLIRRGLADKCVVVKHRAQRTQYWLTPMGREVYRRRMA